MRTMTVATVTKETVPMGVALEMGSNGHVKNRSTIAKPVGQCTGFTYYVTESFLSQKDTTVTINSLYSPLPIRRQEFERIPSVSSEKPSRCYTRMLWVRVALGQACV